MAIFLGNLYLISLKCFEYDFPRGPAIRLLEIVPKIFAISRMATLCLLERLLHSSANDSCFNSVSKTVIVTGLITVLGYEETYDN